MYSYDNTFSKLQYNINELIYDIEIILQKAFMLMIVIAAICFVIIVLKKRYDLQMSGLYFSVGKNKVRGIIFGKAKRLGGFIFSKEEREGHIICLGPSGTGKTTALLIPSLNNWRGTSFTIDISGDISKNVITGNKVIYEPESSKTVPFDIFHAIDILQSNSEKNIALEKIAHALVPELPSHESSGGAKYYNDGGRDIVTAALIAYYHQGYDFIDICSRIARSDYITLFDGIDKSKNDIAIKYINQFAGSLPEHISGCMGEANKAIKLFATNENVIKSIHRPYDSEFCIDVTTVETYNVFFKVSDAQLEIYTPLIRIVIELLLNYLSSRSISSNNILLCFDELASFKKLDLVSSLRKLRKNRVRIFCLTQSLADLEMIYGKTETKAMMNNFAFKILLGATDTETQEYFSKLIGRKQVKRKSVQQGSGRYSVTKTDTREYAVEPENLARLKKNLILIYSGGFMKLRKNYYFKQGVVSRVKRIFS